MNKRLVSQLLKTIEGLPLETSHNVIIESVNDILLSPPPITNYIEKKDEKVGDLPSGKFLRNSSPMGRFLRDFKADVDTLDSRKTGVKFAVEYIESLQKFAKKIDVEEVVVSEIDELLKELSKTLSN